MGNPDSKYWQSLLEKYLAGSISADERFTLEKQALDDPFLMDAMEGFREQGPQVNAIQELKAKIQPKKRNRNTLSFIIPIAASLALIIGATLFMKNQVATDQGAMAKTSSVKTSTSEEEVFASKESFDSPKMLNEVDKKENTIKTPRSKKIKSKNIKPSQKEFLNKEKNTQPKNKDIVQTSEVEETITKQVDNIAVSEQTTSRTSAAYVLPEDDQISSSAPPERKIKVIDRELKEEIASSRKNEESIAAEEDQSIMADYIQIRTITGIVSDEKGHPLLGANVIVEHTTRGTLTDIEGKYELELQEFDSLLSISYTGYKSAQKLISLTDSTVNVRLVEGVVFGEDVVIAAKRYKGSVLSFILAKDGETEAYPSKGLEVFENDIRNMVDQHRATYDNYIGTVQAQFTISSSGYIRNIIFPFSSCSSCENAVKNLIKKSGSWITIPAHQETLIEYEFDFQ